MLHVACNKPDLYSWRPLEGKITSLPRKKNCHATSRTKKRPHQTHTHVITQPQSISYCRWCLRGEVPPASVPEADSSHRGCLAWGKVSIIIAFSCHTTAFKSFLYATRRTPFTGYMVLQSVTNAPGLFDLRLPSRHPAVNINQSSHLLDFFFPFHKSLKNQTVLPAPSPPSLSVPLLVSYTLINWLSCSASPPPITSRQRLTFLRPLTAARVKPLGF